MDHFLSKWNDALEDLQVKINLGEEEVVAAFEKEKEQLKAFVGEARAELVELGEAEWAQKARGRLEELELQLALGVAESREAAEAQRHKLDELLHAIRTDFHLWTREAGEKAGHMSHSVGQRTEEFQTRMDILRLQLSLGTAEAQEEIEEARQAIRAKIAELRQKLDAQKQEAEAGWDAFSHEMGEAYTHFRSAIRKLIS